MSSHDFDAIVVGGGHNGLTNAAYLGKAGLRTLVLEKNDLVGGAAITEELMPGLLVHDVLLRAEPAAAGDHPRARPGEARLPAADDAVVVPPHRRRRLPAVRRRPRPEPAGDPPALAARRRRLRALPPRPRPGVPGDPAALRQRAAEHLRQRPRGRRRRRSGCSTTSAASSGRRCTTSSGCSPAAPPTGSTTTSSTRRSRATTRRPRSSAPRSARCRRAPALVLLFHKMGEHDGHLGSWAFHKGGNGGFTQVLARAAAGVRRRDPARRSGHLGADRERPRGRRRARGRHGVPGAGRGVGARPAAYLPRARRARASSRSTWSTTCGG